ncbi:TPA: hypothetical protein ACXNWT_002868 [Pseudomonas aeruginosa]
MNNVQRFWCHEAQNIRCVRESDYAKLEAEAQALREERDSQQRVAINAMEELAALRTRVLALPDASTVYAALDARERLFTSPENIQVALEAQSRLNGMTLPEARPAGQPILPSCPLRQ